jgi:excisionase family DNA binding protein
MVPTSPYPRSTKGVERTVSTFCGLILLFKPDGERGDGSLSPTGETLMTEVKPILCSIPDAATMLSVSRSKAYELIANGELATVRIGRRRLVRIESVQTLAMGAAA